MLDPITTGYLSDVAANVTASILGILGAACARPSKQRRARKPWSTVTRRPWPPGSRQMIHSAKPTSRC
jgi:hypothetical protein